MTAQFLACRRSKLAACMISALTLGTVAEAANATNGAEPRTLAPAAVAELRIVASEFAFAVNATRVAAGQPVTVVLDNAKGETEHSVLIPATGERIFVRAGETAKRVVVFSKAGDYDFICDLPGHAEAGMRGKLSVTVSGQAQAR